MFSIMSVASDILSVLEEFSEEYHVITHEFNEIHILFMDELRLIVSYNDDEFDGFYIETKGKVSAEILKAVTEVCENMENEYLYK